jgi:hypothetical protein
MLKMALVLAIVIFITFIFSITLIYYEVFSNFFWLLQDKLQSIYSGSSSLSEQIRHEQLLEIKTHIDTTFKLLFGLGFKVYVENQYSFMLMGFGWIGFSYFLLFLVIYIIYGWKIRNKDRSMLLITTIIFSLTSYTLVSMYLLPTQVLLAFGVGLSRYNYLKKKVGNV